MRIDLYSHGFKVSELIQSDLVLLAEHCRPMVKWELIKQGRSWSKQPKETYAAAIKNRREFRFHINTWPDFQTLLKLYNYPESNLQIVFHSHDKNQYTAVPFKVKNMKTPRENQPGIISYVVEDDLPNKMVTLQTGKGKLQPVDSLVLTPSGWQKIGLIRIGDEVIARNGKPTKVIGVYPQGEVLNYRVTFADGRSVEAGAEHLWQSFYVNTSENRRWQVRNTLELKRLIELPNPRVYIPLCDPIQSETRVYEIDPYVLGVLIGGGCLSSNASVTWCKRDTFIGDKVTQRLPAGLEVSFDGDNTWRIKAESGKRNVYLHALRDLGLMGCVANEKFIPLSYLNGSVEQRLALMQGLMDTDGTVQQSGSLSYSTVSETLAKDVQTLVRGLGGIAAIVPRQTFYTYQGEKRAGQLCYEVDIRHPRPSELVSLPRKQVRINDNNQYSKDLKLRVKSIELSRVVESVCIAVEDPERLYITEEYIVTHNTFISQYCAWLIGLRTSVTMKGGYIERWASDLEETFDFERGQLLVIRGGNAMASVQEQALAGELDAHVLLFTLGTWDKYLKNHEETNGKSTQYPIAPGELFPKLGIGFAVNDEAHQMFHQVFRQLLYMHVYKSLALSATMESSDDFNNRMYAVAYPVDMRNDGGGYDAFIRCVAMVYQLQNPKAVRYKGPQGGYSHNAFEESLMSKKDYFPNYLKMVSFVVNNRYIKVREPGQKMLIFCASIKLCTLLVDRLQREHPDLKVRRYCEDDDYDNLLAADISVSTILSAGTAVDIPNLRITFCTTAINSRQSNEQALGRTRRLKDWPDVVPEFLYLVSTSVEKHVEYHNNKKEFFRNKVLEHLEVQLPITV